MRIRRIAILIDGGFFIKRLPKIVEPHFCSTPAQVAESARVLCKRHVQRLIDENEQSDERSRWLDHVYRIFYYDAKPYDGVSHHPILNRRVEFAKSKQAQFRNELFAELRRKRKFALRLGKVRKESNWRINERLTKQLLKTRNWTSWLERPLQNESDSTAAPALSEEHSRELQKLVESWNNLAEHDVVFGLRQKGVDMRFALDISTITLKKQADTLILVTGDSDFVPAAKLARRESAEVILDPMWQHVDDDLFEHIDGLWSGLWKKKAEETED